MHYIDFGALWIMGGNASRMRSKYLRRYVFIPYHSMTVIASGPGPGIGTFHHE